MKVVALIPARYKSTRFPGKPLTPLLGKPMILYVCETTAAAVGAANTYVATDSDEIAQVVREAGFQVIMTSEECLTGTDRIAEAVQNLDADIVINVQGDEPMLSPVYIQTILEKKLESPGWIVNGMSVITETENPESRDIPKVVFSENNRLLYMSRAALPASKAGAQVPTKVWKQVCIYAFEPDHLRKFQAFGRKSYNESFEDIEILRFLDLDIPIRMVALPSSSLAVDRIEDVEVVEAALRARQSTLS